MDRIIQIKFEDTGQDFLTWKVNDRTGQILCSEPFQKDVWSRFKVFFWGKSLEAWYRWRKRTEGMPFQSICIYTAHKDKPKSAFGLLELKHRVIEFAPIPANPSKKRESQRLTERLDKPGSNGRGEL